MKNITLKEYLLFGSVILLASIGLSILWVAYVTPQFAKSSAPTGYKAISASSSQVTIGGNAVVQIFATSSCVARLITPHSPQGSWLRVLYEDSAVEPSPGTGHLLAASSTAAFDSGVYGCGRWRVFNNSASTTIFTITDFLGFQ